MRIVCQDSNAQAAALVGRSTIEARIVVLVHDDGIENVDAKMDWEDNSYCECDNCARYGTVKDFKLEKSNG